jgi:hypothetical protein
MATRRESEPEQGRTRRRPATTPEFRELQLVDAAVELAERQIRDGTASAQVITHFLKLGSTREKLEQQKLRQENELMKAKVEQMASAGRMEELYGAAIDAMKSYAGRENNHDEPDYEA